MKKRFQKSVILVILALFVTTFVAFGISAIFLLELLGIGNNIVSNAENIDSLFAVLLLLIPFLISLAIEYVICRYFYLLISTKYLCDSSIDALLKAVSELVNFLIVVLIAFCLFVKSSIYSYLELTSLQKLSDDIRIGWLTSSVTVVKLAFEHMMNVRNIKRNNIIDKESTTKHKRK